MPRARARRTRRTRRVPRRRRTLGRRRSRRIGTSEVVREKVTMVANLVNDTSTSGYLNIHWFQKVPGQTVNIPFNIGVGKPTLAPNTQFEDMMRNYSFYRIYGLKFKVMPRTYGQSSTNQKALHRMHIASRLTSGIVSPDDTNLLNAVDFKAYNPQAGPVSRFYRLGKYLAGQKIGWLPAIEEVPFNNQMQTSIKTWGEGFGTAESTILGEVFITYYVAFKTRRHT